MMKVMGEQSGEVQPEGTAEVHLTGSAMEGDKAEPKAKHL